MARILSTSDLRDDNLRKSLLRTVQSGNLNFLIGSGASSPAIPIAGAVEKQIDDLLRENKDDEAAKTAYDFLQKIQGPMNKLVLGDMDTNLQSVQASYDAFLCAIGNLLAERKTNLLPRQATIFTTNYDLFFEKACIANPTLRLNDGFLRSPTLSGRMTFAPRTFFNSTFNSGNLYSYRVEIPAVNLVKLHGSLSWAKVKGNDDIAYEISSAQPLPIDATTAQIRERVESYAIVLPQATKFRTTLLDRTYYDLLRIYANELDRENTVLMALGFSFGDVHLLDLTSRALKNPTLRLMIFAYDSDAAQGYRKTFEQFNNVEIVAPTGAATLTLAELSSCLESLCPAAL